MFESRLYKRCRMCEYQETCSAMCIDLLTEAVLDIEQRKARRREYALDAYRNRSVIKTKVKKWKSGRH